MNKSSQFVSAETKNGAPPKTRKFKMEAPILHTLAHSAHSLRPLLRPGLG